MPNRMHPRKRLLKIIRELKQIITDKQSWNDNRPEHPPFDIGFELAYLNLARAALREWDTGIRDGGPAWNRMIEFAEEQKLLIEEEAK